MAQEGAIFNLLDDVIKDIVTLVIHPTYTRPTAGLSMGSSGDFEIGKQTV